MQNIIKLSQNTIDDNCLEGERLFLSGNFNNAKQIFKSLVLEQPENPRYLNNLGTVYWEEGNKVDAIQCWKAAIDHDNQYLDAYINLGNGLQESNKIEEAINIYYSYLDNNPTNPVIIKELISAQEKYSEKIIRTGTVLNQNYVQKKYLISVIISTYNSQNFIEECLSDVYSQSISDQIEIVIIDANSMENEEKLVSQYQNIYNNILYLKTNDRIGIYPAWNIAINLSSGKYIFPFSTNDRLYSKALEILSSELEKDPSTALVYGNSYLTDLPHQEFSNHKTTNYANGKFNWPEYNYIDLLFNCRVGPHPMWRRELHEKIGYFDPKYKAIGDQDFWLRIGRNNKMKHIMDYTGLAWITPDSLSGKEESRQEIFEIQKKHQDIYRIFGNKLGEFPGGGGSYLRTLKLKYGVSGANFSMGQLLHQLQHHIQVENQEIILKTIVSILGSSEVSMEIYDILIDLLQNMNLGNEILFFLGTILEREPANAKAWEVIKSKFPEFS